MFCTPCYPYTSSFDWWFRHISDSGPRNNVVHPRWEGFTNVQEILRQLENAEKNNFYSRGGAGTLWILQTTLFAKRCNFAHTMPLADVLSAACCTSSQLFPKIQTDVNSITLRESSGQATWWSGGPSWNHAPSVSWAQWIEIRRLNPRRCCQSFPRAAAVIEVQRTDLHGNESYHKQYCCRGISGGQSPFFTGVKWEEKTNWNIMELKRYHRYK